MNKYYTIDLIVISEHVCHFKEWSFKQRKDAEAFFFDIISDLSKEYNVSCTWDTPYNKEWNMSTNLYDNVDVDLYLHIRKFYTEYEAIEEYYEQKKEILFK